MAKICHVALIIVLLISACHQGSTQDWADDLTSNINRMTQNINAQVQSFTQRLHAQIENTVQRAIQPALQNVAETVRNLPRDSTGRIITNGNTVIVNSGNGVSRSIISGHTSDGEPFVRDIEERYDGNILYHNEVSYNPRTNITERIRWKLDLSIPGATPEIITDDTQNT